MANGVARARLRPGRDDDIQTALDAAARIQDESDVVRAALRLYFGLEGQEKVTRQRPQPIDRPARPGPLKAVKPVLLPVDKKGLQQDTNTVLDTLLGF